MAYTGKKPIDHTDVTQSQSMTVTDDLTVDTDTLHIDSTNNRVGIGTTSPDAKMNIEQSATGDFDSIILSRTTGNVGDKQNIVWQQNDLSNFKAASISGEVTGASAGELVFNTATGGTLTERMRIQAGGGISFNGDTSAANALDDYEEGTFSPTYIAETTNPTVTYERQNGHYVKIGRQVIVTIELRTNAVSGGSGAVLVSGLPFAPVTESGQVRSGTASIGYTNAFSGSNPQAAYINGGVDGILLMTNSGSDARGPLNTKITTSNLGTGTNDNYLIMNAVYITS